MPKIPINPGSIANPASTWKKTGPLDEDLILEGQGPSLRILSGREAVRRAQELVAPYRERAGSLSGSPIRDWRPEGAREPARTAPIDEAEQPVAGKSI